MHTEIEKWREAFDQRFAEDRNGSNSVGMQYIDAPESKLKAFIAETIEGVRKQEKEKVRSIINKFTYDEDKLAELVTYLGSSPTEKK